MDAIFQDPRWNDGLGPVPRWTPDMGKPVKPGESRLAWIWPRDKRLQNSPLASKRRWKDVLTGKGPGIFIGDRARYGPTRDTWSNWASLYDNLGYRSEEANHLGPMNRAAAEGAYDFRTRRYTKDFLRPGVWSDVKWGRDADIPLYFRNGYGHEWTFRTGRVLPRDTTMYGNDFRYRRHTDHMDWARPEPLRQFWRPFLHA